MNKWRTVRDNYMRVQKKQAMAARSGAGSKKVRGYIYAEQLSFLRRTQEPRSSVSSIDQPSTSGSQVQHMVPGGSASCQEEENRGGAESQMEEDVETQQVAGTATTVSTRPAQNRRAPAADLEQAMVTFMEAQTNHPHQRCMLADSVDMSFFNSCMLLLNKMTEAEKVEYRRRCLGILDDILSRPHHAAGYNAMPQSTNASGSSLPSEVLSTHPAMPPGAKPHTESDSESGSSHTTGPHDPDARRYHDL